MLRFLHEASEVDGPDAFTEPVMDALWELIPADAGAACNIFSGAAPDVAPEARTVLSFDDISCDWCLRVKSPWTDELEEICRRYIEAQDPTPPTPWFVNRAVRESDVMTRSARVTSSWMMLICCATSVLASGRARCNENAVLLMMASGFLI